MGLDMTCPTSMYVDMQRTTTHPEANMKKVIGTITSYQGSEFGFLKGHQVKIIAVIKNAADLDNDPDEDDGYITDDEDLARAGGVTANDRIEVQPWIESQGRFSFASSDPKASDLAAFSNLKSEE